MSIEGSSEEGPGVRLRFDGRGGLRITTPGRRSVRLSLDALAREDYVSR